MSHLKNQLNDLWSCHDLFSVKCVPIFDDVGDVASWELRLLSKFSKCSKEKLISVEMSIPQRPWSFDSLLRWLIWIVDQNNIFCANQTHSSFTALVISSSKNHLRNIVLIHCVEISCWLREFISLRHLTFSLLDHVVHYQWIIV